MPWSQLGAIWMGNFRVLKGDTVSKWVHPLGLEDSSRLGKECGCRRTKAEPSRSRAQESGLSCLVQRAGLLWADGQTYPALLSSTLSLSSGTVEVLASLSHLRTEGSVSRSFLYCLKCTEELSLKVWQLGKQLLTLTLFLFQAKTVDSLP